MQSCLQSVWKQCFQTTTGYKSRKIRLLIISLLSLQQKAALDGTDSTPAVDILIFMEHVEAVTEASSQGFTQNSSSQFQQLFQLSLKSRIIRDLWRKFIPVPKENRPKETSGLRPAALMLVPMKCLEKIIKEHLLSVSPLLGSYQICILSLTRCQGRAIDRLTINC